MERDLTILAWLVIFVAAFGLSCRPKALPETEAEQPEPNAPAKVQPEPVAPKPIIEPAAERVAVTVNGIDITESRIEALIKPQLERIAEQAEQLPPEFVEQYKNQLRGRILEGLIEIVLLDEKVKEANVVVTEEETNEQLKKMASQQKISLEDFKALVMAAGQSFDEVKERVRKKLSYQKLMEAQFAGKINVTEDDAKKYYSENKSLFEMPEMVRASHILIKPDTAKANTDPNEARKATKAKAEDLLKQIKEGADFATLARANSSCPSAAQGGDLNFFRRGQMVPPFEKAAFELKAGQVSDIVETRFGCHIIKVTDHKDPNVISFEQTKDDIIKQLTERKQRELAKQYVDSLKAKANIVYPAAKEPSPVTGSSSRKK